MTALEHAPFKRAFCPSARQTPRWEGIPAINISPHGGNTTPPVDVTRVIEVCQLVSAAYSLTHDLSLGFVDDH